MATLAVKINGLDEVKKKLGKEGQKALLREISEEIEVAAYDAQAIAVSKVPVDNGILRAGINVEGKDLQWIVYTVAEYAGYQEFGTKTKVEIPNEMKEDAAQFLGKKGSYSEFKKKVAEWMRSKGIPESALYPIMAKIMNIGIDPKPFMYPAFKKVDKELPKAIDQVIQRYLDK